MMGDSFQCEKCGRSYARERRRVGKAVVCSCGHKFLVPPPDAGPPRAAGQPTQQRDYNRPLPEASPRYSSSSGDSSADAIPIAEPIEAQSTQPPGRWAEPVETAEPLPEAEVVYDAAAEPAYPADALFAPGRAYGDPMDHASHYPRSTGVPQAILPPATVATRKKRRKRANSSGAANITDWIAYFVLFGLLPMSGLFFLLGVVQFFRLGRLVPPPVPSGRDILRASKSPLDDHLRNKRSRHEAISAGLPIVILFSKKKPDSDDFTLQYDIRRGPLNPASQYIWVVSSPQGRIEFLMTTPAGQGRGEISGRPAQPAGLMPPFTTYIEEQSAGARTRVSNEATVFIGG